MRLVHFSRMVTPIIALDGVNGPPPTALTIQPGAPEAVTGIAHSTLRLKMVLAAGM